MRIYYAWSVARGGPTDWKSTWGKNNHGVLINGAITARDRPIQLSPQRKPRDAAPKRKRAIFWAIARFDEAVLIIAIIEIRCCFTPLFI